MEEHRRTLTLYAYNILGSWEDAKDIVQDVYLKFAQLPQGGIADTKSYLIRMVVNLSIDRKRKLARQLNSYVGPWLPDPISTEDPHFSVHRKDILSYSMLVLLEKLDATQRAVFILKEALDYSHDEIAPIIGISVENSRKILSRARQELHTKLSVTPNADQMKVVNQYLKALEDGNMGELERLLSEDITVTSDGGGKATAFRNIIAGVRSVSALLAGLYKKLYNTFESRVIQINHEPAIVYSSGGKIVTCQIFSIEDQRISKLFFIRNPDKLELLGKKS